MSETNNAQMLMRTHERDPTYYYSDGNIVFLVGGVLFKVYSLLVLPADSISSATGDAGQRYPLGVDDLPTRLTYSSDTHPIVLPDISVTQFRNYLLALLGRVYDTEYRSLFTSVASREKHNQELLLRFLDIADVSHRFGMNKLRTWAFSQLEIILKSTDELTGSSWDRDALLRLHSCARSSGRATFATLAANFIQYFISVSTVPEGEGVQNEHASFNLDTCVQLFKHSNLLDDDPVLFGCVFASILALGHRSTAWMSGVTGGQRAILYAAQVQLTAHSTEPHREPMCEPSGELRKKKKRGAYYPSPVQLPDQTFLICNQCLEGFNHSWDLSFKKYRELKSVSSLRGLTALARLPQYRQLFSAKLAPHRPGTTSEPSDRTVGFLTDQARDQIFSSEPRHPPRNLYGGAQAGAGETCTGPEWLCGYLDNHIQLVYQELTERYKDIASAKFTLPSTNKISILGKGKIDTQVTQSATVLTEKGKKSIVGDGTSTGFVTAVLAGVPSAYKASYGWLVFAQNGPKVQRRSSDILPGDVIVMTDIKLKGHKGLQGYSTQVNGELVGIVGEFEVKKHKLKVWQPALQPNSYPTIESVSYRMEDLKSGTIQVYRVAEDV